MIRTIDIAKFGIYDNFKWREKVSPEHDKVFRKLNIIYGRNYSGKTTLSRIFRSIEKQVIHENYGTAQFTFNLENGNSINPQSLHTYNDLKFRVYNVDFIKDNLSWLHNPDTGCIEPFTVFSEVDITKQERLDKIKEELDQENPSGAQYNLAQAKRILQEKKRQHDSAQKALRDKLTNKAREIKNNTTLFDRPTYNLTHIENDISIVIKNNSDLLDETIILELKNTLSQQVKTTISKLPEQKPKFDSYVSFVNELCSKVVKPSQIIKYLENNPELNKWVDNGIKLHRDKLTICGFCGSQIQGLRWDELDAHFTKELEDFKQSIKAKIKLLKDAKENLDNFISLSSQNFDNSLVNIVNSCLVCWKDLKIKYTNNLNILIGTLEQKELDIFNNISTPKLEDFSQDILNLITELNKLIDKNLQLSLSLSTRKNEAQEKLRLNHVKLFTNDIKYLDEQRHIQQLLEDVSNYDDNELNILAKQIKKLELEKAELEQQASDGAKAAHLVNHYLTSYFKHNSLSITSDETEGSLRFVIKRNNENAHNLSEGECSLISFCYFMAKIEDELKDETNHNKLILYIDDPISSLDSNNIFFMFSLIESVITKHKKYGQLFLSTHNLEFLKYIKRLTIPKYKPIPESKEKKPDIGYFIVERLSSNNSKLSLMPTYLENYVTEFNYLFKQVHSCAFPNNTLTEHEIYTFGNNLRKFLEAYLFFRYPSHKLDNTQRLEIFFNNDTSSVTAITRITNEYSHLENRFDRSIEPVDTNEIQKVAEVVIKQMERKDKEQFDSLVISISN